MDTKPLPPVSTERVILHCLATGQAFRSTCGAYDVDFYSDLFVVSAVGTFLSEVFDEEEFSLGFSDTLWYPHSYEIPQLHHR